VAAARIDTRFDTAGRVSGSKEIPGVESVTARLILEEMLHKSAHWHTTARSNIDMHTPVVGVVEENSSVWAGIAFAHLRCWIFQRHDTM
jgi:hypothetical protein